MGQWALLPCFACGTELRNALPNDTENQPSEGTEFRTYGHYGSTFWDDFVGEELVLNICDDCLRTAKERLGQQKRFLPIKVEGLQVGLQWVDRPLIEYCGKPDDGEIRMEIEDIGQEIAGVEWAENWREVQEMLLLKERERQQRDGRW